jgi:hypothetical protein
MPTISLDSTPFAGRTSTPPRNREVAPRQCRACGSQLAGRRYQGVQDIGGKSMRVWACDCGAARRMPLEAAA